MGPFGGVSADQRLARAGRHRHHRRDPWRQARCRRSYGASEYADNEGPKEEPEAKESDASFHRRERTFGPFTRTIALPYNVDADQVKASAQNGILTVNLPRPESDKPRKIKISQS